jgi:hypothetical protein
MLSSMAHDKDAAVQPQQVQETGTGKTPNRARLPGTRASGVSLYPQPNQ